MCRHPATPPIREDAAPGSTVSSPAMLRSETTIESTYQYQTTEVLKEGGKTVRTLAPSPMFAPHGALATTEPCILGTPTDCRPQDGRIHVPHGAQGAEARPDVGRLGRQQRQVRTRAAATAAVGKSTTCRRTAPTPAAAARLAQRRAPQQSASGRRAARAHPSPRGDVELRTPSRLHATVRRGLLLTRCSPSPLSAHLAAPRRRPSWPTR